MKAALYPRVSSDDQVDGFSLIAQLNILTEYCKKNNIEIYKVYSEDGVSAKFADEDKRPKFNEMINDAEKKLFNIILVHKYDRFARNVELSQRIKRRLRQAGVNVISITEPIENSPIGFITEGLMELLAEYYIKNLSQEVKKGMRERVKQGLHNGSVPYGYKIDKISGNMVINEEQAVVVRKIFDMYNEGYGTPRISNWLSENGISSAIPGAIWNHHAILYILKNVKYIGYIRHAGEVYQGVHEPIIENDVFELAQKFLVERKIEREPKGKNELNFMLLGLARCGLCGKKMGIHSAWKNVRKKKNGELYYYYVCTGHRKHENTLKCSNNKYYPSHELEEFALATIEKILEQQEPIIQTNRTSINYLAKNQIERIEKERARAKAAYLSETFSLEEYNEIKNECDSKLNALKIELEKDAGEIKKEELKSLLEEVKAEPSPAKKRLKLSKNIEAILVFQDKLRVRFYEN